MKTKAIRIKVTGYVMYVPEAIDYPGVAPGDIEGMLKVDLEQANDDPDAMLETVDNLAFAGEVVTVEIDGDGNITSKPEDF